MPRRSSVVDVRDYLGTVYNLSDGPDESDLEEAMNAILTLQFVHDLKSDDVSSTFVIDSVRRLSWWERGRRFPEVSWPAWILKFICRQSSA